MKKIFCDICEKELAYIPFHLKDERLVTFGDIGRDMDICERCAEKYIFQAKQCTKGTEEVV